MTWEDVAAFVVKEAESVGEAVAPGVMLPIEVGVTAVLTAMTAAKPWTILYKVGHTGLAIVDNHQAGNGNGPPPK
jgi:hypothetical protein